MTEIVHNFRAQKYMMPKSSELSNWTYLRVHEQFQVCTDNKSPSRYWKVKNTLMRIGLREETACNAKYRNLFKNTHKQGTRYIIMDGRQVGLPFTSVHFPWLLTWTSTADKDQGKGPKLWSNGSMTVYLGITNIVKNRPRKTIDHSFGRRIANLWSYT